MKELRLAFILLTISVSGHANGAITYNETSDFSGNLGSPFIIPGALGFGVNTISGTLPADFGMFGDTDVFHVNNPDGLEVTSIIVTITNFVGTPTDPSNGGGILRLEDPGFAQQSVGSNGDFTLLSAPNNASVFEFRFGGPEDFDNSEAGGMDYLVTMNAVPEPSIAGLVCIAAVGFVATRRRPTKS